MAPPVPGPAELRIETAGPLTTLQDGGRSGLSHLAVSPSGSADRAAWSLSNRLLGNPEDTAALETTYGGLAVRLTHPRWVVVTGPHTSVRLFGLGSSPIEVGVNHPFYVPAGLPVQVATPRTGVRHYLGVRGGFALTAVLGSLSTDTLGRLGPAQLRDGDRLRLATLAPAPFDAASGLAAAEVVPGFDPPRVATLEVDLGPRWDFLSSQAQQDFLQSTFTTTSEADRVGVRLAGPTLERNQRRTLASEPLIAGAVQVPDGGQPLIFLADHPTTGGYPVVAVVRRRSLNVVAQLRPGHLVRFRRASPG